MKRGGGNMNPLYTGEDFIGSSRSSTKVLTVR